mgnify:CR=1 FL=1
MRIHDISVKYFLKLLVLRRRSTGVFIAGEHDKENDIWDSNVPCGASGAIIMNGKRWKHWRNTRKFIRVLEKLGVDFSDSGDNTDEKSWVKLLKTYPDGKRENIWEALFTMGDIFRTAGRAVGRALKYPYPEGEDRRVKEYLHHIHGLPCDAAEIY